jgi:hypothetical protein
MSAARDVDFTEALAHGTIDPQALRSAVFSCMQCEETEQCQHWLDEAGAGSTPEPRGCRNKALLDRMRA